MSVAGFSTEALKVMAAKGLSLADVIEIGDAMGVKRSTAAMRQARYRAKKRNESDITGDVTRIPNEDTSNPPSEPEGSSGKTPAKKLSKTFLPDDWTPPPVAELTPKARACAEQWTRESYETVAEAFGLYWRREQKKTGDWRLTWCGWIIREHSKVMRDQKFGNAAPAEPKRDDRPLTVSELHRAIQFNEDQGNHQKARAYRFQLQARQSLAGHQ